VGESESEKGGGGGCVPQIQVVVAGEVIVQFDAVLEGLHGGMGEAQRCVILLAEVRCLVAGGVGRVGAYDGGHVGDGVSGVVLFGLAVGCTQ
jgi:hypothetical protein